MKHVLKKTLCFLLVLTLLVRFAPVPTASQTPVSIGFYVQQMPLGQILFLIEFEHNHAIASGELVIEYDPNLFLWAGAGAPAPSDWTAQAGRITHHFSIIDFIDHHDSSFDSFFAFFPLAHITAEDIAAVTISFTGIRYPSGEKISLPDRGNAVDITDWENLDTIPFTDVHVDDWFYDAVRWVYFTGAMQGISGTTFAPHMPLNRASMMAILPRIFAEAYDDAWYFRTHPFTDVPNNWSTPYIAWAYEQGISRGIGGGRFAPNDILTREQLATMMHRHMAHHGFYLHVPSHVEPPAGTSNWAHEYMRWAAYHNLLRGAPNPQAPASRADAAYFNHQFFIRWWQLRSM